VQCSAVEGNKEERKRKEKGNKRKRERVRGGEESVKERRGERSQL